MKRDVNKMTKMAVLSALSIVLMLLIRFPIIPAATFLVYEPADVPILIGGFMLGAPAGLIITVVVSTIQAILVNPEGGWVGLVMHVISTGTLVAVASCIYRKYYSYRAAIAALIAGSISMTLIMIPANLFFTVKFYGYPYDTVVDMLIPVFIPFNLIKSFLNSFIVAAVYLPLKSHLEKQVKAQC